VDQETHGKIVNPEKIKSLGVGGLEVGILPVALMVNK